MNNIIKLIRTYFVPILLGLMCIVPTQAMAGIFDPPVTDKSIEYLGLIFGGSVGSVTLGTSLNTSPFLGNLFQIVNGIVLSIAIAILSYVSSLSILNTAHEGEIMGKKWSSVWIPLRSTGGLLLLAPVPGSGYSLLQVTVMWIILNGVGAADKVWNFVIENLAQGVSVNQNMGIDDANAQKLLQQGNKLSRNILKNLICMRIIKNNDVTNNLLNGTGAPLKISFVDTPSLETDLTLKGSINFGADDTVTTGRQKMCGSIDITASVTGSELSKGSLTPAQLHLVAVDAYQTKKQALGAVIEYIKPVANAIADQKVPTGGTSIILPSNISSPGLLYNAVAIFQDTMARLSIESEIVAVGGPPPSQPDVQGELATGQQLGWISAGSFYFTFSRGTQGTLLATATSDGQIATSKGALENQDVLTGLNLPALDATKFTPYMSALNSNASLIDGLFQSPSIGGLDGVAGCSWTGILELLPLAGPLTPMGYLALTGALTALSCTALRAFKAALTPSATEDPLLAHTTLGVAFMIAAETCWIGLTVAAFAANIAGSILSCVNPIPYAILSLILALLPPLFMLLGVVWVAGVTLSIYTPMVPYMMFSITSLGWIILVIEAIVAAPIVALGLIMPSQDELGKIVPALGIVAGIFLKPMLMIIGLLLAAKVYKVGISIINLGFDYSLTKVQEHNSYTTSLFSWVPMVVLYTGFIMAMVNKSYALIYQLPDKILRWIGITGESEHMQELGQIKQGFDQNTQGAQQALSGPAQAGAEKLQKDLNEAQKGSDPTGLKDGETSGSEKPAAADATTPAGTGGTASPASTTPAGTGGTASPASNTSGPSSTGTPKPPGGGASGTPA